MAAARETPATVEPGWIQTDSIHTITGQMCGRGSGGVRAGVRTGLKP